MTRDERIDEIYQELAAMKGASGLVEAAEWIADLEQDKNDAQDMVHNLADEHFPELPDLRASNVFLRAEAVELRAQLAAARAVNDIKEEYVNELEQNLEKAEGHIEFWATRSDKLEAEANDLRAQLYEVTAEADRKANRIAELEAALRVSHRLVQAEMQSRG